MMALATTTPPESIRITTDGWTVPYWEAAKQEQLVAPQCRACGAFRFPPSPFCPECRSQDTEWVRLSGRACVFSFSVVRGLPGQPGLLLEEQNHTFRRKRHKPFRLLLGTGLRFIHRMF